MRTLIVYCKKCKVSLTGPLVEISEQSLRLGDGQDALEKGQISMSIWDKKQVVIALGEGLLNSHSDIYRFQGCCGSGGMDGLNKLCSNGHEVATEFSDCYMPHYIAFDTDKITVKEKISDYDSKTVVI